MLFWWICGGKSVLPVLLLRHLGSFESTNSKRYTHLDIHTSPVYNSHYRNNPSVHQQQMDKKDVRYIYIYIYMKSMAPHSSTLAWKIPWTEEPGRLQSMGLLRVGHDWATSLSLFTLMHWRRKWQSTPMFLPGESQGQGSLVGCQAPGGSLVRPHRPRLWGRTESDTTEVI